MNDTDLYKMHKLVLTGQQVFTNCSSTWL